MPYKQYYDSPLGRIVLTCDDEGLTGLWFDDGRPDAEEGMEEIPHPHHASAARWLDDYFARKDPGFLPPLHFVGTPFQCDVWEELLKIPYGETRSYGEIAAAVAEKRGVPQMSAQAVGGAAGRNHIVIIVPCHRVIGADGNLTGYTGGLEKKIVLLALEGADLSRMYLPKKKTENEDAAGAGLYRDRTGEDDAQGETDMKKDEVFAELKEWGKDLIFNRTVQMTTEECPDPPAFAVHMTMSAVKYSWKMERTKKFLWVQKWNYTEKDDSTGETLLTEEFSSCEEAAARLRKSVDAFVNGEL